MTGPTLKLAALLLGGALLLPVLVQGREPGGARGPAPHMNFDSRYHHDHYYPPRGYAVPALPPGARSVYYGGNRYFMRGGVWYRPYGPRFVVFAPPIGLVVPFLPEFYTTVWFGGLPYYYANDTYYLWDRGANGYVVSSPPPGAGDGTAASDAAASGPGTTEDFFVYPRNGQSEAQTAKDRFECHQWAVSQTGFDPSEPGGGVDTGQNAGKRTDYKRAISACLEGRQYSVR
ncbi:MAG: hypothetical protein JSS24_09875 [Proteobacteria bacterium]|nr:hypothetical protein [Pseudomonadota bacterium]